MDVHFNSYKVRYDVLDSYMIPIKRSQIINSVNIFVSLDDLFHGLHKPSVNNEFQVCGQDAPKQFISNIFNLLAHYRYWAIKRMRMNCKVYGVFTSTLRSFKNNIYVPNYRKHFKDINSETNATNYFVNETIRSSLPLIEVISHYIPDVYVVDSKYLEPSMIPIYINNDIYRADWNILISRDTYDLQYVYKNKWGLISPKGEHTQILTTTNMWDYINIKDRVYLEEAHLHYPYQLYDLAKALVGDKYRSIPRLRRIGWKTLFKYFDTIMEEYDSSSIVLSRDKLLELIVAKQITNDMVNDNLNAIDVELQYKTMMEVDKQAILVQLEDIPDYENLKLLNQRQFHQYPLNLQFLTDHIVEKKRSPFD